MDDKAKVPVGEPGTPEAAATYNRRALTQENIVLESSGYNYHLANLPSSVDFIVFFSISITITTKYVILCCPWHRKTQSHQASTKDSTYSFHT